MNKHLFLTISLLFGISTTAFPAGIRIGFMDTFALGRGNTFAATADSPAAIFYNPAGLTQLDDSELSVGAVGIQFSSEHTAEDGTTTNMRDRFAPVPHFYYGHNPKHTPFAFGIGAYFPFGLITEWPEDGPFSHEATRSELIYLRINPVITYQVNPQLSIGGGPTFNFTEIDLRSRPVIDPAPGFVPPEAHDYRLEGDDRDIGFNLGIRWQPHEQHAFGLSYHSHTRIRYSGSERIRGPYVDHDGDATVDRVTFPEIVIAGYSYRPTPEWNLEVNIDWTRMSRLDSFTVRGLQDEERELNWKSTFFYGLGVTRYFPNDHFVSAGYLFTENAVPGDSFHPFVPDSHFHFFSLGVGSTGQPLTWQAGYHYGHGPRRNIPGPAEEGGGRYENHIHSIAFTLSLNF